MTAVFLGFIALSLLLAAFSKRGHAHQKAEDFFVASGQFRTVLFFFLAVGETYSIATILGYPGESFRVLFIESLGKDEKSRDEFATILIDANASEAFFGDPWRLSEDVLSDGAANCIKKLPEEDRIKK